ncbi:hypothetical protein EKN06_04775 [Croceicoccus ponticola]|uniref:Uncharacterized protein n=1 Tax=Croceicoccus ponticola TaxID=2217664 RepID=A0A437H1F9_9SPHN|nr:hypothetical protein [Croceicoccus ponticola]RVQ69487.1 hypothetical protein EKN06_04775 [Croceicoccus ponticola]
MTKARHSLGLVGLSPIECAKIAMFIETEAEAAGCPWLVLHSDSCDALIVPSDVEFTADPYQVLIRLVRYNGAPTGGLAITAPVNAPDLIDILSQAQEQLGKRQVPAQAGPSLRVKMEDMETVPANDHYDARSYFGAQASHMTNGSAALKADPYAYASHEEHLSSQPSAMATPAPQPAFQPFPGSQASHSPQPAHNPATHAGHDAHGEFCAAWDQIAVALYSIVQNSAPAVAEIRIENLDMIRIDFRFRAYNSRIPLEHVSANGSRIAIRSTLVEAFRPPIVNLPGESLDKLFWFIGSQAFHGMGAPWMKPEDRYRLRRWPNFTELNHAVADMRAAAAIGNCFLNAAELSAAAGITPEAATRTLNAYSLMGLLEIQTDRTAAPVVFAPPPERASGGLFSKLRSKLGL